MQSLAGGREGRATTNGITEMLNWLDSTHIDGSSSSIACEFDYGATLTRLLKGAERRGMETSTLLRQAGLDPQWLKQADRPLRGRELIGLMQVLKTALGDEHFGLSRRRIKLGTLSMLVEIALECDALGEAL